MSCFGQYQTTGAANHIGNLQPSGPLSSSTSQSTYLPATTLERGCCGPVKKAHTDSQGIASIGHGGGGGRGGGGEGRRGMCTPKVSTLPFFNYFYECNESCRGRGLVRQRNDSNKRLNETNEGARLRIFLGSCTAQTNSSTLYCIQFSASGPTNTMHLATRMIYIIRRCYWTVQRL